MRNCPRCWLAYDHRHSNMLKKKRERANRSSEDKGPFGEGINVLRLKAFEMLVLEQAFVKSLAGGANDLGFFL